MNAASVRSRVFVDANQDEGTLEWGGPEANDGCPSRKKEREVWVKTLGGDSGEESGEDAGRGWLGAAAGDAEAAGSQGVRGEAWNGLPTGPPEGASSAML